MSFASYAETLNGDRPNRNGRNCGPRSSRRAAEIAAIVLGFIYVWPLALAYLAWKSFGYPMPQTLREQMERGFAGFQPFRSARWNAAPFTGTGNRAFDDYRRAELDRLDQERRRLDDEARDFSSFVEELKRAKDREEFDAYMAKRRAADTSRNV